MTTFIKSAIRSLATSFAIVFALVPASGSAENLYWIGGAGTEDVPADIYDQNNWASGSYSGSSISRKPTASDNLYFKFAEPTYLTNSMENASSVAVCNEVNFNGGTCILVGTIRSASTFRLAQSGGSDLEFQVTEGGMPHSGGTLAIGCGKKATLTVDGGSVYSASIMRVGNGSNATLTIKNGTVELASDMILSQGGTGTVKLEGGILKTKCIKKGSSTGTFYFDGGTLQANAENNSNFIAANLGAYVQVLSGGGVIDANGKSIKIDKPLEGSGAMRLKGGGTITFGYNSNYTGGTTIELGTKVIANGDTKILDNLVIDGRAVLAGGQYDVLVKSGLTEESIENITLENFAADSTIGFDSEKSKITVTLAAPTGVNTSTPIMAFKGMTLNQIKYADFTSRIFGRYANDYNALDSAKGCNKKFYYKDGSLSSIVVEFQAYDGTNIRCVVVEFVDGEGGDGVYAMALGARYMENAPLGHELYSQTRTWTGGTIKFVTTSRTGDDYGACDFRVVQGESSVTAWTLDGDKAWSALRNGAALARDEIVQITVTDADAVLTVDENVAVGQIVFVNGSGATFKINEGVEVSADSYSGLGFVLNNGIFQKWGAGTVEMKFDQASRGVFAVNAGTLKAVGKRVPVSPAGSPIDGDPDETSRSNYLIDVKNGATYDVNGQTSVPATVRLAEGANFISSADAEKTYGQTIQLILAGDADVTAAGNFGLIGQSINRLDLDAHTLTVNGATDKEFMLCATTITGTGTISVKSGKFCTRNSDSTGEKCTISIGPNGKFENNRHFAVKNFVNNGTISYASSWGRGMLEVTGLFESKKASIPKLTLTGATLKARPGAVVTVLEAFEASGALAIDASDILKEDFDVAEKQRIGVLTVPTENKGGDWEVVNCKLAGVRAKWINNGDNTCTLYVCKPAGTRIIIR